MLAVGDSGLVEKVKWQSYGADIGSCVGSLIGGGLAAGSSILGTGPGAIVFMALGSAIGSSVGTYIGRFIGGMAYDMYEAYRFSKSLQQKKWTYDISRSIY